MSDSDFFRARLDAMIDLRHPLAVLASRMPWSQIETAIAPYLKRCARSGRHSVVVDLFGTTAEIARAGVSAAGRPRLPIRLMVSLLYLKHAYGLSVNTPALPDIRRISSVNLLPNRASLNLQPDSSLSIHVWSPCISPPASNSPRI